MSPRGSGAAPDAQGAEGRLGRGHEAPARASDVGESTTRAAALDATGLRVVEAARVLVDALGAWPAATAPELGAALRGLEVAVLEDRRAEADRGARLGALVEAERTERNPARAHDEAGNRGS